MSANRRASLAAGVPGHPDRVVSIREPGVTDGGLACAEERRDQRGQAHPLASREVVPFAELLDEPSLALPPSAGPLGDYWLALDARDGKPPRIGNEIAGAEETYEALADGQGAVPAGHQDHLAERSGCVPPGPAGTPGDRPGPQTPSATVKMVSLRPATIELRPEAPSGVLRHWR
jgi:hypothetical protein